MSLFKALKLFSFIAEELAEKYRYSFRTPEQLVTFIGDFISGALLGASISSLFFPLNVVKQRMQSTVNSPFLSAWTTFQVIWIERNGSFKELFRGITLNYTRYLY